jgi:hypothetical protein
LTITLLICTACGSNADSDESSVGAARPTAESTPDSTVATSERQIVPDALRFRAPLVGGGEIDMSTLAGRPVVLWFWAPY